MSVTLEQVGALLELIAPISFAEEWDNSGFNVNLHNTDISGIMICLDVLPETIEEAAEDVYKRQLLYGKIFFGNNEIRIKFRG